VSLKTVYQVFVTGVANRSIEGRDLAIEGMSWLGRGCGGSVEDVVAQ
jgi:hypothetical protein